MTLKERAVQTAGERLEHLEVWMRRVCIATAFTAAMTGITAFVAVGMTVKYLQIANAIQQSTADFKRSTADFKLDFPEMPTAARLRR